MNRANMISHIKAGLMLGLPLRAHINRSPWMERVDVSQNEETRPSWPNRTGALTRNGARSRAIKHEVNPQLLLRNVLAQLGPLVADNDGPPSCWPTPGMLNDAYAEMRDIIKNTRIEAIDLTAFTRRPERWPTTRTFPRSRHRPGAQPTEAGRRCRRRRQLVPTRSSARRFSTPSAPNAAPGALSASSTNGRWIPKQGGNHRTTG